MMQSLIYINGISPDHPDCWGTGKWWVLCTVVIACFEGVINSDCRLVNSVCPAWRSALHVVLIFTTITDALKYHQHTGYLHNCLG